MLSDVPELLLRHSLQVTIAFVIVWGAVRLLSADRPHLGRLLLIVVLLKCVTPPVVHGSFGLFSHAEALLSRVLGQFRHRETSEISVTRSIALPDVLPTGRPSVELLRNGPARPDDSFNATAQLRHTDDVVQRSLQTACVVLWVAGMLMGAGIFLNRWRLLNQRLRRSAAGTRHVPEWLLSQLCVQFGVRRQRIRLLVTSDRHGPAVIGLFRPTIVIPECLLQEDDTDCLKSVLAHELVHIRRGDLWISLLMTLARTVLWFHPAVWLLADLLNRVSERSCDEEAIAGMNCPPEEYARSLLYVLEQQQLKPVPGFPGVRTVDITSQRLERIMRKRNGFQRRTPTWCWLIFCAMAVVVLPGAQPAESADDNKPTASEEKLSADERARSKADSESSVRQTENRDSDTADPSTKIQSQIIRDSNDRADSDVPSDRDVIAAVAKELRIEGDVDEFLRQHAENIRIVKEQLSAIEEKPRFYPIVGPARRLHAHFKCTVYIDDRQATAYLDRDQLLRVNRSEVEKLNTEAIRKNPLEQKVSLHFDNSPLADALSRIAKTKGINIALDSAALNESGLTADHPVSINVDNITLRSALDLLLTPLDLVGTLDGEVLKVTTKERAFPMTTRAYSVADLVVPLQHQTQTDIRNGKPSGAAGTVPDATAIESKALVELITATIAPGTWSELGGQGVIRFMDSTLSIVVRQRNDVHDSISDLLSQLRRLQDTQIVMNVRIISTDGETLAEHALNDDFNFQNSGGIAVISTDTATAWCDELLEHGAVTAGSIKATLFSGQPCDYSAEITSREKQICRFTPVWLNEQRMVRVSCSATARGEQTSPVSHLVKCAPGDSLIIDMSRRKRRTDSAPLSHHFLVVDVDVVNTVEAELDASDVPPDETRF